MQEGVWYGEPGPVVHTVQMEEGMHSVPGIKGLTKQLTLITQSLHMATTSSSQNP